MAFAQTIKLVPRVPILSVLERALLWMRKMSTGALCLVALASAGYAQDDGVDSGSVSPEMGGAGFEAIAARDGWSTGTIRSDMYGYVADTDAVPGGSITLSMTTGPLTLRAFGKGEAYQSTRFVTGLVYESLVGVSSLDLEVLPNLATHWKVDSDGTTLWFRIDPLAHFADGMPVTTDDILATYKLLVDTGIESRFVNQLYKEFETPVAVSPYIFTVRAKTVKWESLLSFGGMTVLPAHIVGSMTGKEYLYKCDFDMPSGSGPYMLAPGNNNIDNSIVLIRNPAWWAKGSFLARGIANFDTIRVEFHSDGRAVSGLLTGRIDVSSTESSTVWKRDLMNDQLDRGLIQRRAIYNLDPVGFSGIAFNTRHKPLDDERVREALIRLFDREGIMRDLHLDDLEVTTSFSPNTPYENRANPRFNFDPERAGKLLDDAGFRRRKKDGMRARKGRVLKLDFLVSSLSPRFLMSFERECADAGIEVQFRNVEDHVFMPSVWKYDFDLVWIGWGGLLFPNPTSAYHSSLAEGPNTNNITGLRSRRVDELCELERTTASQSRRTRVLQELDSVLVASKIYALGFHRPYKRIAFVNRFGHPEWYVGRIHEWTSIALTWWVDPVKDSLVHAGRTDSSIRLDRGTEDVRFWLDYERLQEEGREDVRDDPR